jgi:hypothetical protein
LLTGAATTGAPANTSAPVTAPAIALDADSVSVVAR